MYDIPLTRPYMDEKIKRKVCEVLDSGYLTEGPVTRRLEEQFREYIGCKHAIAATSCTTGLEMALRALEIGPGDEVVVPDYTYPATADVAAIVGADIVLVDTSTDTMLIDYDALESAITEKTGAVIPVSQFGNPLDYGRLNSIREKYGVYIVEDAACAIGAEFNGRKVGSFADISVFSMHPRKFVTTGEGGMVTTDNPGWADWMRSYKHFGMDSPDDRKDIHFAGIGTNYKLSDIQAAVGAGQMEMVDTLLARRRELSDNYIRMLSGVDGVIVPSTTEGGVHSRQSFVICVDRRDEIMEKMRNSGIEVQIGTFALHRHGAFSDGDGCRVAGRLDRSDYAFDHCLALPLFHDMEQSQQETVVSGLTGLL